VGKLKNPALRALADDYAGRIGRFASLEIVELKDGRAEHAVEYRGFAATARQEGFVEIAAVWDAVAVAERQHEKRFRALHANLENGRVFLRDHEVTWRCRNCGYLHDGKSAPELCPACVHPQAHFELLGENW
jgi:rubrerythrin